VLRDALAGERQLGGELGRGRGLPLREEADEGSAVSVRESVEDGSDDVGHS